MIVVANHPNIGYSILTLERWTWQKLEEKELFLKKIILRKEIRHSPHHVVM